MFWSELWWFLYDPMLWWCFAILVGGTFLVVSKWWSQWFLMVPAGGTGKHVGTIKRWCFAGVYLQIFKKNEQQKDTKSYSWPPRCSKPFGVATIGGTGGWSCDFASTLSAPTTSTCAAWAASEEVDTFHTFKYSCSLYALRLGPKGFTWVYCILLICLCLWAVVRGSAMDLFWICAWIYFSWFVQDRRPNL